MEEKLSNKSDECSFIHETVFFSGNVREHIRIYLFPHPLTLCNFHLHGRKKKKNRNCIYYGNCIYHIDLFYRFVLSRYADGL